MHLFDLLDCVEVYQQRNAYHAKRCIYATLHDHGFINEALALTLIVGILALVLLWRVRRRRWTIPIFAAALLLSSAGFAGSSYLYWLNHRPIPPDTREMLFEGIEYVREVRTEPRPIIIHALKIDLDTPGLHFLVTPHTPTDGYPLAARTTSQFLDEFDLQIAVNADGFSPWHSSMPWDYYPHVGDPVAPFGFTASLGDLYTTGTRAGSPVVYISEDNQVSFNQPAPGTTVYNAVGGITLLVEDGINQQAQWMNYPNLAVWPRTAYGLDESGRIFIILVIDGRQPHYSEGVTEPELGEIMLEYGIYEGMMMDGGGSSTLVMQGADGKPDVLNSPIHTRIPGRERPVANHLGLYARRLDTR